MCTADPAHAGDDASGPASAPGSGGASQALRAASAAMDCVNAAIADLDGAACGETLIALGGIQAKLTAAHAAVLRRFDAANAHEPTGTARRHRGSPRRRACRRRARGPLCGRCASSATAHCSRRLAAGDITDSLASSIADWTRKLPAQMRDETDRILLHAAAAGASTDDLAAIAACAIETWRAQQPDADDPSPDDRYLQLGTTFGDAGCICGDLTPECATAVRAVLESLGKKAGPEDDRTEPQRFHDALQLACTLLLRARLVPARAGADTQAVIHIPLSQLRQLPGAQEPGGRLDPRQGRRGRLPQRHRRGNRRVRRADRPGRHRHHGPRRH